MSYQTAAIIRSWTNSGRRNPVKYTITGYLDGSQVGDPVIVYTEKEMETEFAKMRDQAIVNPKNLNSRVPTYDQVKVQRQYIVLPSLTE